EDDRRDQGGPLVRVRARDHVARIAVERERGGAEAVEVRLADEKPRLRAFPARPAAPHERDLLLEEVVEPPNLAPRNSEMRRHVGVEPRPATDRGEVGA